MRFGAERENNIHSKIITYLDFRHNAQYNNMQLYVQNIFFFLRTYKGNIICMHPPSLRIGGVFLFIFYLVPSRLQRLFSAKFKVWRERCGRDGTIKRAFDPLTPCDLILRSATVNTPITNRRGRRPYGLRF